MASTRLGVHFMEHLTKIRIQFNPWDPRGACVREFLQRCGTKKAQAANPKCEVIPRVRNDDQPPVVELTFTDGKVDVLDCRQLKVEEVTDHIFTKVHQQEVQDMFKGMGITPEQAYMNFWEIDEQEKKRALERTPGAKKEKRWHWIKDPNDPLLKID